MKTHIVPTVTEELIDELEAAANAAISERSEYIAAGEPGIEWNRRRLAFQGKANPATILALLQHVRDLKADAERRVPLYEAVERACGELPDGWQANICMENGAGWVELYDDCGVLCDNFPTNNERLDYTLNDAIDAARSPSGD